ncbi:putative eka-like protein [Erysiphe necator]|uniref:Putative eka-like protein n=1 Tax=Uncinula necator TaxID=52586 RepID=A0A0B1NUN7_UNCNE|nr:putative eka-like protein [Erysiphe necator]
MKEVENSVTFSTSNNSRVTEALNGQKKARLEYTLDLQVNTGTRGTQKLPNKEKHGWRNLSPAGIHEVIVKKLVISPSLNGKINPVRSGFALSPCSTEARDTILNAGNGLFLSGAKSEPATNWVSVQITTVLSKTRKRQGEVEISISLLSNEIERVCSVRPAHVKLYGRSKPEVPHKTWMGVLVKALQSGFRVFDESGIARSFKQQQPLEFCKRCNGHHPAKNCSRSLSCSNCDSTNNAADSCMTATKCRYCGGPYQPESRRCLACSTRAAALTKEQLKTYRQAGEREYQVVSRATTTDEPSATVEKNNKGLTSSQDSDNTDNIPASPIEISTGDAMRL